MRSWEGHRDAVCHLLHKGSEQTFNLHSKYRVKLRNTWGFQKNTGGLAPKIAKEERWVKVRGYGMMGSWEGHRDAVCHFLHKGSERTLNLRNKYGVKLGKT